MDPTTVSGQSFLQVETLLPTLFNTCRRLGFG